MNSTVNYKLIRWPQVHGKTGLCRSYAHALAVKGDFPRPVKIGSRASAWIESEVDDWIKKRIADSRGDAS